MRQYAVIMMVSLSFTCFSSANENSPIFVLIDNCEERSMTRDMLERDYRVVESPGTCEILLAAVPSREACLLVDAYLSPTSGLELLHLLRAFGYHLPTIMIVKNGDVSMAVQAMRAGAFDVIERPIDQSALLTIIDKAFLKWEDSSRTVVERENLVNILASLTSRQREIMDLVIAGMPTKNIAADIGISQRTVENHRAKIMRKMGAKSIPGLVRIVLSVP